MPTMGHRDGGAPPTAAERRTAAAGLGLWRGGKDVDPARGAPVIVIAKLQFHQRCMSYPVAGKVAATNGSER